MEVHKTNYRRSFEWDNINFTYKRIALAYPKKYVFLSHIYDDNGLDYIRTYQATNTKLSWDGEEYIVYIKRDSVTVNLFVQKYVFNDSDSLSFSEENLLDLLNAWKNQNIHNGLVVLDEDGKIDSSLLGDAAAGAFVKIKEIVTEYPTEGMEIGDVYYNSETHKLFIAIDEENGVIDDPKLETLYIYDNEFYSWYETGLLKFSRIQSREIKTIKEI